MKKLKITGLTDHHKPRLYDIHFNKKTNKSPYIKIKCYDCKNNFNIYIPYGQEKQYPKNEWMFEIGGVLTSRANWNKIFKHINLID